MKRERSTTSTYVHDLHRRVVQCSISHEIGRSRGIGREGRILLDMSQRRSGLVWGALMREKRHVVIFIFKWPLTVCMRYQRSLDKWQPDIVPTTIYAPFDIQIRLGHGRGVREVWYITQRSWVRLQWKRLRTSNILGRRWARSLVVEGALDIWCGSRRIKPHSDTCSRKLSCWYEEAHGMLSVERGWGQQEGRSSRYLSILSVRVSKKS